MSANTRHIQVLDDIVPMVDRHRIYGFVLSSKYMLGWSDTMDMAKSQYRNIHSSYSADDVERSGMGLYLSHPSVSSQLQGYQWSHSIVNLSTPSDVNFTHTHQNGERVVLYYVNLEWKSEWYGETMFFDEDDESIILAARYTPGRIIVFDGAIPHSIRPQSNLGPQYRFTLANVFKPAPQEA